MSFERGIARSTSPEWMLQIKTWVLKVDARRLPRGHVVPGRHSHCSAWEGNKGHEGPGKAMFHFPPMVIKHLRPTLSLCSVPGCARVPSRSLCLHTETGLMSTFQTLIHPTQKFLGNFSAMNAAGKMVIWKLPMYILVRIRHHKKIEQNHDAFLKGWTAGWHFECFLLRQTIAWEFKWLIKNLDTNIQSALKGNVVCLRAQLFKNPPISSILEKRNMLIFFMRHFLKESGNILWWHNSNK